MKLSSHIIITFAISSVIYFIYNSFSAFISSFLGGILIDIDHLLDYYLHIGKDFKIKHFFNWCYKNEWETLILFFHSVELVLILWLAIWVFNLGIFWIGLSVGVSQHIIFDIIFNSDVINVFSYFFTYRYINDFRKEYIIRRS